LPCRAANARYEGWRVHARKEGDWNGVIPAGRARRHLKLLSRVGIGRRTVAEISGVPQSLVHQIKTGRRRRIRARTERRLFLVTSKAMNEARLVNADSTWRMIGRLSEEGFSKAEIARRLGLRSPCLQIRRARVRAHTAVRLERFYRRIMVA
jgi:predicted transcriptional regulator